MDLARRSPDSHTKFRSQSLNFKLQSIWKQFFYWKISLSSGKSRTFGVENFRFYHVPTPNFKVRRAFQFFSPGTFKICRRLNSTVRLILSISQSLFLSFWLASIHTAVREKAFGLSVTHKRIVWYALHFCIMLDHRVSRVSNTQFAPREWEISVWSSHRTPRVCSKSLLTQVTQLDKFIRLNDR